MAGKAAAKALTEKEVVEIESKLIPLLENSPSDGYKLKTGETLFFQRPTLPNKYKYQIWFNKKIKEVGLDSDDEEGSEYVYFFNFYGLLNASTVRLITPDGTDYLFTPKEDTEYKFLFEKYVTEEVYNKDKSDEDFILDAVEKYLEWQNETSPEDDDIKNS